MLIHINREEIEDTLNAYDLLIDRTNDVKEYTFRTKLIHKKKK